MPTVTDLVAQLHRSFDPKAAGDLDATVQLEVSGEPAGEWHTIIRDGKLDVQEGRAEAPAVTLHGDAEVIKAIIRREMDPVQAVLTGRLKLQGNIAVLLRVVRAFPGIG